VAIAKEEKKEEESLKEANEIKVQVNLSYLSCIFDLGYLTLQ